MMYSFGQRKHTRVWDEPFYASYLLRTGLNHPMRDEIMTHGILDYTEVMRACTKPSPTLFYQKHMCQHIAPEDELNWILDLQNVLLIRHPARVIASYHAKRENPISSDLGFDVQARIFDLIKDAGQTPIVIGATDIRANPEVMLEKLCAAIGIGFDPAMLSWPKGGNKGDGIWASHWYNAVHNSTGFAPPESNLPNLPDHLRTVLDECLPHYEKLSKHRIKL